MDKNSAFDWLSGAGGMPADGGIEQNEAMMREAQEHQMELARLVYVVFETPQGLDLMDRLDQVTIRAPLMQVSGSLVSGEVALSPADWAYVREGQNSVVRFLQDQIELAKNPPVQTQPEEGEEE